MEQLTIAIGLKKIELEKELPQEELAYGQFIFNNVDCQILSQSSEKVEVLFSDTYAVDEVTIFCEWSDDAVVGIENSLSEWNRYSYAALLQFNQELGLLESKEHLEHKKYSREGMIKRVLQERRRKADTADYRVDYAGNIYGDHILTNEHGVQYKIFLRDFENQTGYSNSPDAAINKLGTTKHIMYVFRQLSENKGLLKRLSRRCPFFEIYLDPLNSYRISWFYPHDLSPYFKHLVDTCFGGNTFVTDENIEAVAELLNDSAIAGNVVIRPEVIQKINAIWEEKSLAVLRHNYRPDYSGIKASLYNYQKEGIAFAACRKAAIIADEMGLGKTIQAIGTALQKFELFGFSKVLVICPASLKAQWKREIERFTDKGALVVQGKPEEREQQYLNWEHPFLIVNYETVLRDQRVLAKAGIDFLILDEAQRVKNYETRTANAVKQVKAKHTLIITGTPIENKLIDLFSIVGILDDRFLGPLWEFSYQHCLFDSEKQNKINGYYNLKTLKKKMESILIRREKAKVIEQLPQVSQHDVRVSLTPLQTDYHASYARGLSQIVHKKFLTPYDMKKMQLLLASMRMVCDSSYLVDENTNDSPKLTELQHILLEKLDIKNSKHKVIIFSEWVKMHKIIGKMLRDNNIGFTELNGKVPVAKRGELIKRFETSDSCRVFLSTEAGGSGLNLQVADVLINFELPWNPAKKNQRIGRIDRLGQKSEHLTIFNLISNNSIEERISLGLLLKQSLFDGVLNESNHTDFVDFSEKGRSQFLEQITELVDSIEAGGETEETEYDHTDEKEMLVTTEVEENDTTDKRHDEVSENDTALNDSKIDKAKEMEAVMNNGMQFLAGMFKMATGNDVDLTDRQITVDPENGEVTMKFKLPI